MRDYERAAAAFSAGQGAQFAEIKAGHINATYRMDGEQGSLILQKVNTFVFRDPDVLMNNIFGVTRFLREKLLQRGEDPERRVLEFLPTLDGRLYYADPDGGVWRAYRYVDGVKAFDRTESPELFRRTGEAFGRFQLLLAEYPADGLGETIPFFHHTGKRLDALEQALKLDSAGRAQEVAAEAEAFLSRREKLTSIVRMLEDGSVPVRVTHNDTKINNVLMDEATGEALAVIDLDTVMPGSVLYDFGDAIRTGANAADEDERDVSKVVMDLKLFRAFCEGFLPCVRDVLTPAERAALPLSAIVMTAEVGVRFLTDYLNGDVYFKTEYAEHNLVRARAQLTLMRDMEQKETEMMRIVEEILR